MIREGKMEIVAELLNGTHPTMTRVFNVNGLGTRNEAYPVITDAEVRLLAVALEFLDITDTGFGEAVKSRQR